MLAEMKTLVEAISDGKGSIWLYPEEQLSVPENRLD